MPETILSSRTFEVRIGPDLPFVIIGERINPTGRKLLASEMAAGDYSRVIQHFPNRDPEINQSLTFVLHFQILFLNAQKKFRYQNLYLICG